MEERSGALGSAAHATDLIKVVRKGGEHVPLHATAARGSVRGFSARGWLGQYLVVVPDAHLVGVRMRAPEGSDYSRADEKTEANGFGDFPEKVLALVPPSEE